MSDDRYTWKALYNDNTSLLQINPDGSKNAYGDIDRSKLVAFQLLDGEAIILEIPFDPGQRLIWRRRIATAPGVDRDVVVHIVGKQETINGENRQVVFALFQDGHTEVSDKWDEQHPWFFRVQMHPSEGEGE